MESNIKSSFIPDKMPAQQRGAGGQQSQGGGVGDILILVAVVALAAALALAAGVFIYDRYLDANVQKKSEQLERAQQAFEPALIQELVRLDGRLQAADEVLSQHLAPSELFNLLEELTLQSVSYSSLDYSVKEDRSIEMTLKGRARSVNGVALQASVFGQHNAITNPIFSDLDLVSEGTTFQVKANINPSALRYSNVFAQYSSGIEGDAEFEPFTDNPPGGASGVNTDDADAATQEEDDGAATEDFGDFGNLPTDGTTQ